MGQQQDLINKNSTSDKTAFKYSLNSRYLGPVVLKSPPNGYEADQFSFTRDMKYFGVFRKFTQNEIKFVKDGRDYVQSCYEKQGSLAEVDFKVEELNPDTNLYEDRFNGTLDFSTYKISEYDVSIQVIDGTFIDKIFNRQSVKVDLMKTVAIDGENIGTLETKNILIPALNIVQKASWRLNSTITHDNGFLPPITLVSGEFTEAVTPDRTISTLGKEVAFFKNSTEAYTGLHLRGHVTQSIQLTKRTDSTNINYFIVRYNSAGVQQSRINILAYHDIINMFFIMDKTFDYDIEPLTVGDYIVLEYQIVTNNWISETTYTAFDLELSLQLNNTAAKWTKGVMYHEAWERLIVQLTGQHNKVYSDLFGRTDIGYSKDGIIGALTTGMLIRQITGVNDTVTVCLKDLFEALSLYCIGIGLIDDKLRIEPMEYWFKSNVILDLTERIKPETITKEVVTNLLANSLKFGFNAFDYDRIGGIYEFNTTSLFTTIMKLENEFSIVSPYRADMTGILKLIVQAKENTDNTSDNTIYMLDIVRSSPYKLRTSEGFEYATGGVNTGQNFNLMLTPARTLRRWGRYIRAMMERWPDSFINWQSSANGTTLKTKLSGSSQYFAGFPEVAEDANIQIKDLNEPLWHPEKYVIETYITRSEFNSISLNPYGLIKIGENKYGWLLSAKCKNDSKEMTLELLRANLKYVTPV